MLGWTPDQTITNFKHLDQLMDEYRVTGAIALHHGRIILERYAHGRTAQDRWFSACPQVASNSRCESDEDEGAEYQHIAQGVQHA